MRRVWAAFMITAAATAAPHVLADEIVHFTNGAEMTVRSHAIEKDMVKLDLGGNSSITFPLTMVDKIVGAGKNVFLNPAYHPSNQALPVDPASLPAPLPDRAIRGGGTPVGYRLGQSKTGTGLRLGEASNEPEGDYYGGSGRVTTVSDERHGKFTTPKPRVFDTLRPEAPGARSTIEPPGGLPASQTKSTIQIRIGPTDGNPAPPPAEGTPESTPPESAPPDNDQQAPPPQDPPESD